MNRPLLQKGDKGKHVEELQKLLNKWLIEVDGEIADTLETDMDFGTLTDIAVRDFQHQKHLFEDGKVGKLTWAALLGIEMYNCFDIPPSRIVAVDKYTCWAAATATLLGKPAPIPATPGVDYEKQPNGTPGGINNSHENMQEFANKNNMQMFKAEQLTSLQLVNLIDQFGRLMLNMKGVSSDMKHSTPEDSHLVNLLGARGNGQRDGTTLTVWNPSNGGEKIVRSYRWFKNRFPRMTYQVFYTYANKSTPK